MLVKVILENTKKNYDLNENDEAMVIGLPMVNENIYSNNLTTDISALTSPAPSASSNTNMSTLTMMDGARISIEQARMELELARHELLTIDKKTNKQGK